MADSGFRLPDQVGVPRMSATRIYMKDTFHCNMVGLASCHQQAMFRYSDCLAGKSIRPLSY